MLLRSALSQMDVRTISPLIAGYLLGVSGFGWPLIVARGLKIVYDLLLLAMFRVVRPPEIKTVAAVSEKP